MRHLSKFILSDKTDQQVQSVLISISNVAVERDFSQTWEKIKDLAAGTVARRSSSRIRRIFSSKGGKQLDKGRELIDSIQQFLMNLGLYMGLNGHASEDATIASLTANFTNAMADDGKTENDLVFKPIRSSSSDMSKLTTPVTPSSSVSPYAVVFVAESPVSPLTVGGYEIPLSPNPSDADMLGHHYEEVLPRRGANYENINAASGEYHSAAPEKEVFSPEPSAYVNIDGALPIEADNAVPQGKRPIPTPRASVQATAKLSPMKSSKLDMKKVKQSLAELAPKNKGSDKSDYEDLYSFFSNQSCGVVRQPDGKENHPIASATHSLSSG